MLCLIRLGCPSPFFPTQWWWFQSLDTRPDLRTSIQAQVMKGAHISLTLGHPGASNTLSGISRKYWWPNMAVDIKKWSSPVLSVQLQRAPVNHLPVNYCPYRYLTDRGPSSITYIYETSRSPAEEGTQVSSRWLGLGSNVGPTFKFAL